MNLGVFHIINLMMFKRSSLIFAFRIVCCLAKTGPYSQGHSQKKLMTEAMSMEDLRPRQSVHGWVLFLGIKSVYNDYKQQKWKKLPRQVPRLACY